MIEKFIDFKIINPKTPKPLSQWKVAYLKGINSKDMVAAWYKIYILKKQNMNSEVTLQISDNSLREKYLE